MMFHYFALVPVAALRREIDGNLYACVGQRVTARGVVACDARMVRADSASVSCGVARVPIGKMGDAIAQTVDLPFGLECAYGAPE